VEVGVEHPVAGVEDALHGGPDGVAVDPGTDRVVDDVLLVRDGHVLGHHDRRLAGGKPSVEEADPLRGVRVRSAEVREDPLVEVSRKVDGYGHVSALNRRATIWVSVTFSFACQEKACHVRPRMWMLPFQFFAHGVFTRSAKKSRYS
jgi:hypothetical protein